MDFIKARYVITEATAPYKVGGRDGVSKFASRQEVGNEGTNQNDNFTWWDTETAEIVKWAILLGLFFSFVAFMLIGRWHAKSRIRKGLMPLRYHRWLLKRDERARYDPNYVNPQAYYHTYRPEQYGMNSYPPPVYDPNAPSPPTYQPPEGSSKVDPSQRRTEPTRRPADSGEPAPEYTPPPGPPPSSYQTDASGSSSNPYRL